MSGQHVDEAGGQGAASPLSRKPNRARVAGLLALLFATLLMTAAAVAFPHLAPLPSARAVETTIEEREQQLDASTWERSVLRGAPMAGDGGAPLRAALESLHRRRCDEGLCRQKVAASVAPAEGAAQLALFGEALDAVRLSLQHESMSGAWARGLHITLASNAVDALLLEAATTTDSPGECLELLADRIRFDQDAEVGGGAFGRVPEMEPVVQIAIGCAARASDAELASAFWEMQLLATHRPPLARALRRQALSDASLALLPTLSAEAGFLDRLRHGGDHRAAIEKTEQWLAHDESFRATDELRLPAIEGVAVAVYPGVSMGIPGSYLHEQARMEARVKELALALSWLVGGWQAPTLPDDESSRDPFSDKRFVVERKGDDCVAIVSVGTAGTRDATRPEDETRVEVCRRPQ